MRRGRSGHERRKTVGGTPSSLADLRNPKAVVARKGGGLPRKSPSSPNLSRARWATRAPTVKRSASMVLPTMDEEEAEEDEDEKSNLKLRWRSKGAASAGPPPPRRLAANGVAAGARRQQAHDEDDEDDDDDDEAAADVDSTTNEMQEFLNAADDEDVEDFDDLEDELEQQQQQQSRSPTRKVASRIEPRQTPYSRPWIAGTKLMRRQSSRGKRRESLRSSSSAVQSLEQLRQFGEASDGSMSTAVHRSGSGSTIGGGTGDEGNEENETKTSTTIDAPPAALSASATAARATLSHLTLFPLDVEGAAHGRKSSRMSAASSKAASNESKAAADRSFRRPEFATFVERYEDFSLVEDALQQASTLVEEVQDAIDEAQEDREATMQSCGSAVRFMKNSILTDYLLTSAAKKQKADKDGDGSDKDGGDRDEDDDDDGYGAAVSASVSAESIESQKEADSAILPLWVRAAADPTYEDLAMPTKEQHTCPECGKAFKYESTMRAHVKRHGKAAAAALSPTASDGDEERKTAANSVEVRFVRQFSSGNGVVEKTITTVQGTPPEMTAAALRLKVARATDSLPSFFVFVHMPAADDDAAADDQQPQAVRDEDEAFVTVRELAQDGIVRVTVNSRKLMRDPSLEHLLSGDDKKKNDEEEDEEEDDDEEAEEEEEDVDELSLKEVASRLELVVAELRSRTVDASDTGTPAGDERDEKRIASLCIRRDKLLRAYHMQLHDRLASTKSHRSDAAKWLTHYRTLSKQIPGLAEAEAEHKEHHGDRRNDDDDDDDDEKDDDGLLAVPPINDQLWAALAETCDDISPLVEQVLAASKRTEQCLLQLKQAVKNENQLVAELNNTAASFVMTHGQPFKAYMEAGGRALATRAKRAASREGSVLSRSIKLQREVFACENHFVKSTIVEDVKQAFRALISRMQTSQDLLVEYEYALRPQKRRIMSADGLRAAEKKLADHRERCCEERREKEVLRDTLVSTTSQFPECEFFLARHDPLVVGAAPVIQRLARLGFIKDRLLERDYVLERHDLESRNRLYMARLRGVKKSASPTASRHDRLHKPSPAMGAGRKIIAAVSMRVAQTTAERLVRLHETGSWHPNLLSVECVFFDKNVYPILEWQDNVRLLEEPPIPDIAYIQVSHCPNGTILQWLQQRRLSSPANAYRRLLLWVFRQLLEAVAFLHMHGLVHGHISPNNVLISETGMPKLADYHRLGEWPVDAHATTATTGGGGSGGGPPTLSGTTGGPLDGRLRFTAPESLEEGEVSEKSDVYAVGLLLYAALFPDEKVSTGEDGALEIPMSAMGDPLVMLCKRMTSPAASVRPKAMVALSHDVFTQSLLAGHGAVRATSDALRGGEVVLSHWSSKARTQLVSVESLDPSKHYDEYKRVVLGFTRACPEFEVVAVQRVQNRLLLSRFMAAQRDAASKGGSLQEMDLYHGSLPTRHNFSLTYGFPLSLPSNCAEPNLGKGVYLHLSTRSALDFSPADGKGVRRMFLVRALIGRVYQAEEVDASRWLVRAQTTVQRDGDDDDDDDDDDSDGEADDSSDDEDGDCFVDNHEKPLLYVIPTPELCYPAYAICFRPREGTADTSSLQPVPKVVVARSEAEGPARGAEQVGNEDASDDEDSEGY